MIATLVNTGFLPTDTSPIESPIMIVGYVISGLIVVVMAFLLFYYREDFGPELVMAGMLGLLMAFFVPAGVWASLQATVAETNQKNLTENIKAVYDIDSVMFEDGPAKDKKIAEPSPLTITVTKDGKAYKVILNQDNKTFEPNLSSFETDSIDIKTLKRTK